MTMFNNCNHSIQFLQRIGNVYNCIRCNPTKDMYKEIDKFNTYMSNNRVVNKGVNNNMYATSNNTIVKEHKRNMNILDGVLLIVDIKSIKHHMRLLNGYHSHISLGMFLSLSIIKQYKLKTIQLEILYNSLYYNGHIK